MSSALSELSPDRECCGCGQQLNSSMFSLELQHVRFEGTPMLCNSCSTLVPPSPLPDAAAEMTKALQTSLLVERVKRTKRGISSVAAAAASTGPMTSKPSLPPQSASKRVKHSRGSAIVAAAAAAKGRRCPYCATRTAYPERHAHTNFIADRLFSPPVSFVPCDACRLFCPVVDSSLTPKKKKLRNSTD